MRRPLLALSAALACNAPQPAPSQPAPASPATSATSTPSPSTSATSIPPPARDLPLRTGATLPDGPLAVTHAGVGSPMSDADGAERAAQAALTALRSGQAALDAAIAGTVALEDDPRYNAGTGANIRLDGKTIQLDAALMTDDGRFAAVAAIERVKNPIRAARLVLDSPHVLLVGEGATRFAHKLGLPDELPLSPHAEEKYRARMQRLREVVDAPGSTEPDWRAYWNFPGDMPDDMLSWREHGDTVGTVVRTADRHFAATLSTGGTSVTLYGRVGDVPIYGAGLFAGPAGAVACTGQGEEIIRQSLAKTVYLELERGTPAADAVARAAAGFDPRWDVGLIAVDRHGWGAAATLPMAHAAAH